MAIILRMISLSTRPLWYDEAFSILFSEKGFLAMVYGTLAPENGVASDIHPLGYYTVLWGWMGVFGESLYAVRMLSISFGIGVVILAYRLGQSVLDKNTALVIAFLVALSPFQVHYAQEIRMYAMLTFFLLLSTLAIWEGMQTGKWYWWVIFTLAAVIAQYTHTLAAFYLLPLALTPLIFRRRRMVLKLCLATLTSLILYFPWLLHLPEQFSKVQQSYWTEQPGLARLVTTLLSFTTNLPLPGLWLPVGLFIVVFVLLLAIYQSIKALQLKSNTVKVGYWLAYMAFVPPLLLFMFSQWKPIYIERALLTSGVMFLTWIGWVITKTTLPEIIRVLFISVLILGMLLGLIIHITYRGFPYAPLEELTQSIRGRFRSGDVVLHSNKLTMLPSIYYDRELPQSYLADPAGSGSDTLAPPTQMVLGLIAQPSLDEAVNNAERIWFIIFSRAIDEYIALGYQNHPHLSWLENHYRLEGVEIWDDLQLFTYVRE